MPKLDFSYLVAPCNARDFLDQYWQKSALVMKRGEADRDRELLESADANDILTLAGQLPAEAVEVIGRTRAGEKFSKSSGAANAESGDALAGVFSKGATIRIKAIERFCEPLGEFCRNLEAELGFPVRANLYCTPGNSRGFNLHFDTHEVFVLQLSGTKQWQIFEPTVRLPLEFVPPLPFENDRQALKRARGGRPEGQDVTNDTEVGPLALEALLEPGDCLYLPRGFVHQAAAHDEPSVHLSIGVHVLTWLDLLSVAMGQLAYRNEDFRRALPVGVFKEPNGTGDFEKEFGALAQLFGREALFGNAVSEIAESFARRPRPGSPPDNHDAVDDVSRVDSETRLAGNGPLRFYLAADGTMAGLMCNVKELWLPVAFAPALRFVAERNLFRPGEIPGLVSDNGRLAFVRNLLKEGFLRIASEL